MRCVYLLRFFPSTQARALDRVADKLDTSAGTMLQALKGQNAIGRILSLDAMAAALNVAATSKSTTMDAVRVQDPALNDDGSKLACKHLHTKCTSYNNDHTIR